MRDRQTDAATDLEVSHTKCACLCLITVSCYTMLQKSIEASVKVFLGTTLLFSANRGIFSLPPFWMRFFVLIFNVKIC